MKQYELSAYTKKSNGAIDKRITELNMILSARNKKQAVDFAYECASAEKYNTIFPESGDDSVIGYSRARQKITFYACVFNG